MSTPVKPTPVKYCETCGKLLERKRFKSKLEDLGQFKLRKYCSQKCFGIARDAQPSRTTEISTCHYHSRRAVPPGPCQICGKENALDVHHIDHDYTNNDPSNLMRICRSCHNKMHRQKGKCVICGKPHKGHGYCVKHLERFRKYGDPLMFKRNQYDTVHKVND